LKRFLLAALLSGSLCGATAQTTQPNAQPAPAFDVATIKPIDSTPKTGRFIMMQTDNRFVAKNFTLKLLIAAAWDLNPRAVSGGPAWMDSDHYDITALTPGDARPGRNQQMAMLRTLLGERFQLQFHREQKEFSIYELSVAKGGPKLKESAALPTDPSNVVSTVYPQKLVMPARNVTMDDFVAVLQRAILDRPVVNKTGLTGRYDFDLEWAPDETEFGGEIPAASSDAPSPPLFTAVQEQLGLRIEATHGPISTFVVDKAERPIPN
jgi:uncharacterized protein (TIGR03435 family)